MRAFFIFCLMLVFVSCGKKSTNSEVEKIISSGKLIVAMCSQDMAPFFMKDASGKLVGFELDLLEEISKGLGVKLVFDRQAKTFDEIIDRVASGEAHIGVSKLSYTEGRAKKVLYSEPYITIHQALLCSRDYQKNANADGRYTSARELLEAKKGDLHVLKGSAYVHYATALFPGTSLVQHENGQSLMESINRGEGFCAFRDEFEIKKYLLHLSKNNPLIYEVTLKDNKDTHHVVVNKQLLEILESINNSIRVTNSTRDPDMILSRYQEFLKTKIW